MTNPIIATDEQQLLADSIARSCEAGRNLADLGLTALPFEEGCGGVRTGDAPGLRELAVAFHALGQALGHDPALTMATLGGSLIADSQWTGRDTLIADVIGGKARIAAALHEPGARANWLSGQLLAHKTDRGWRLDGIKTLVLGADHATHFAVLAAGGGLFCVPADRPGLSLRPYKLRDGSSAADITFTECHVDADRCVCMPDQAADGITRPRATMQLALAAEAAGISRAVTAASAHYLSERRQFGVPLASFQVLQHRLADMAVSADQCEALVAANCDDIADQAAMSRMHRAVCTLALSNAKAAIQLHGGYGMTEDFKVGRALRRVMTLAVLA